MSNLRKINQLLRIVDSYPVE